jgi:hypothetical protein
LVFASRSNINSGGSYCIISMSRFQRWSTTSLCLRWCHCQTTGLTIRWSDHNKAGKHWHCSAWCGVVFGDLPKYRPLSQRMSQ